MKGLFLASDPILVVCAVIEHNGAILAVRRRPPHHLAGLWEFPGGKIEDDETPEAALAREILEELGLPIIVGQPLDPVDHHYPEKSIRLLPYRCSCTSRTLHLIDHDVACWLPPPGLHKLQWAPADLPIVKQLNTGLD